MKPVNKQDAGVKQEIDEMDWACYSSACKRWWKNRSNRIKRRFYKQIENLSYIR